MADEDEILAEQVEQMSFSSTFEVLVGPEKTKFVVHKDIICQRSTFFDAAVSQRWNKISKPIELQDELPILFDAYLYCAYTGRVRPRNYEPKTKSLDVPTEDDILGQHQHHLLDLYMLADKLGDVVAANHIVDAWIDYLTEKDKTPFAEVIGKALKSYSGSSPLHRLLIEALVYESSVAGLRHLCKTASVPRSFLSRVLLGKAKVELDDPKKKIQDVLYPSFTSKHKCRYHLHDEEHPDCGANCEWDQKKGEERDEDEDDDEWKGLDG